jgi:hypothetical protein
MPPGVFSQSTNPEQRKRTVLYKAIIAQINSTPGLKKKTNKATPLPYLYVLICRLCVPLNYLFFKLM